VLGNIGHPSAVGPLIEVLAAERDGKLHHESIVALVNIGPPAVRGIINAATNVESNYTMRSSTEEVLKRMGIRVIQPLINVILDGNPPELALAVKVINQMDDPSVIEILPKIGKPAFKYLVTGLESDDSEVRANVAEVLDKIGWKPETRKPELLYAMAKRQLDKSRVQDSKSRCDLEELTLTFRYSDNEGVRVSVVESLEEIVVALGETVYDETTGLLIYALKDKSDSVRIAAAKALGHIHSSCSIEALIDALDNDFFYSGQVSESLINIGTDTLKPLIAALNADKWDDLNGHINAIQVLGRIGDSQ
jgi:HEAT repeat protein